MASPMVEGRVDPHKKAHFNLHISDRIAKKDGGDEGGGYSGVKYNHKPAQSTSSRTTTLTSTSANQYKLKLEDKNRGNERATDVFQFTGQRTVPKKSSYVLVFDPNSQKATLEPLSATYTFNLTSKNGADIPTSTYPHIYPRKSKTDSQNTHDEENLFAEEGNGDNENDDADQNNPYDFRHFLGAVDGKGRRGDESDYNSASPDYRTGTGSAMNTPLMGARKAVAGSTPLSTSASTKGLKAKPKAAATAPKPRKRKSPEPDALASKKSTTAKKAQATPTVRLDRRPSSHPKPETKAKTPKKAAAAVATKVIKSAEIVHSSDDSELDAEGSVTSSPPPPQHIQRSPSPVQHYQDEEDEDSDTGGGLEIEVPDERPVRPKKALASLGLGQSIGLGGLLKSPDPARGPISLASAANSVDGSPARFDTQDADELDFGDIGGAGSDEDDEEVDGYVEDDEEVEERPRRERDGDVEPMDLGPPAQNTRKMSVGGIAVEEDEDDPLYKEMMEGLAGGDSSEESEEE